ncbi:MAG TPA: helix-turn-helix domain-containing protein [Jatrophihabitans sp.]
MASDERSTPDEPVQLRDARAIRALAHPARLAVLDALTGRKTITATEAAEVAGLSPSAMSYHLRALAKWGIVREADAAADGRERRWERAGAGLNVDPPAHGADAALAFIATHYFDQTRVQLARWLDQQAGEPEFWRENSVLSYRETWLTEEQVLEVRRIADTLADQGGAPRDNPPPGARRVRMAFMLFPIDSTPPQG